MQPSLHNEAGGHERGNRSAAVAFSSAYQTADLGYAQRRSGRRSGCGNCDGDCGKARKR
jgi:hypothetical protein